MTSISPTSSSKLSSSQKSLLAGGIAGSVAKTFTAPLSRLTILYQVSPVVAKGSNIDPKGQINGSLIKAFKRVVSEEGILALWRGNLTSVIHRFPYSAVNFSTFELSRKFMIKTWSGDGNDTPVIRFLCGAFSGAVSCFTCYPLDLVRTRLTVLKIPSSGMKQKQSIIGTLTKVIEHEGFLGLYRGLGVSLLVAVPNLAIGFAAYGTLKEKLHLSNDEYVEYLFKDTDTGKMNFYGSLFCGACSGITSSLITFPFDVIRRRLQVFVLITSTELDIAKNKVITKKASAIGEFRKIVKAEGILGMYRGIVPELLKVSPMVGITFCVYEFVTQQLNRITW